MKTKLTGARPAPTKKAGRAKTRPQSPAAPSINPGQLLVPPNERCIVYPSEIKGAADGKEPGAKFPPPREVVDVDKWHVPPLPVSPAFKIFPAIERYNKAAQELIDGLNAMGKRIQEAGMTMKDALSALHPSAPPPPKGPVETR